MDAAIERYKKAISLKPDYGAAKHMLSALTGDKAGTTKEYVENLFDGYSKNFEASLVEKLDYKIPKLIKDILIKTSSNEPLGSILDLGCGTGLFGSEIRDPIPNLKALIYLVKC